MKKHILIASLLLLSCKQTETKELPKMLSDAEIELQAQQAVDSTVAAIDNQIQAEAEAAAKNQEGAPVEVLKAELVNMEYSNHRNIRLKYKNVSDKTITGIKFEWYGKNAFGDPADMGNIMSPGRGGGFTDETLRPGRTGYGTWEILSTDAKTITAARAYEVAFSDGTKWEAK